MINVRYADAEDYSRTAGQFEVMGTPKAKPASVREFGPDEIVLYRENLPNVVEIASALRHEIGHVKMGHSSVPFRVLKKGVDKAAQAKYSLQEFEAIYWGYYKTGTLDRKDLELEREVASDVLGSSMVKLLEAKAKVNVRRRMEEIV